MFFIMSPDILPTCFSGRTCSPAVGRCDRQTRRQQQKYHTYPELISTQARAAFMFAGGPGQNGLAVRTYRRCTTSTP